jgi:hypothetical protein
VVTGSRVGAATVKGALTGAVRGTEYHGNQEFSIVKCTSLATIMTPYGLWWLAIARQLPPGVRSWDRAADLFG